MQPLEVVVHVFDETDAMGISRTEVKDDGEVREANDKGKEVVGKKGIEIGSRRNTERERERPETSR